jgi:very-short-patch-repair endonuclease
MRHQARDRSHTRERQLRHNQTFTEQRLWSALRRSRYFRFRRQHRIGRYIVDFYCSEVRLVIEVDGGVHEMQRAYDQRRDARLRRLGNHVLRFRNEEVLVAIAVVVNAIEDACTFLL